ncbi:MAG: hypothetical protein SAL70_06315 [Scytonema sp. PMC 1070.18]|nr:hypothetical protein [Scytonema sp. PMC 1070.18]
MSLKLDKLELHKMNPRSKYKVKTDQNPTESAPQTQQVNEADYYNACADLAQERSDYFHLQYSY